MSSDPIVSSAEARDIDRISIRPVASCSPQSPDFVSKDMRIGMDATGGGLHALRYGVGNGSLKGKWGGGDGDRRRRRVQIMRTIYLGFTLRTTG